MKDVKKNMKIISKNFTKEFMIDIVVSKGTDAIVNKAIEFIPNPAAQTAARVAGFAGYIYIAMKLTSEEKQNIESALYDMIFSKNQEDFTDEFMEELNQKLMEDAAKVKEQDA